MQKFLKRTRSIPGIAGIATAALLGTFVFFGQQPVSISATGNAMNVPCTTDGSNVFFKKCGDLVPGVIKDFQDRITKHGNYLYTRGERVSVVDTDTGFLQKIGVTDPNAQGGKGYAFGKQICSLLPNQFNNFAPEGNNNGGGSNHVGQACGNYINVQVHVSLRRVSTNLNMGGGAQLGSRETSFIRGGWGQILNYHMLKVTQELQSSNQVKVSPACQEIASNIDSLAAKTTDLSTRLVANLGADQIQEIKKCQIADWDNNGVLASPDVGPLRQSAQQLCTARDGVESATVQLAVCETFARAGTDYRQAFGNTAAFFSNQIAQGISATCGGQCRGQCSGACRITFRKGRPQLNVGACEGCVNPCVNTCYQTSVRAKLQQMMTPWSISKEMIKAEFERPRSGESNSEYGCISPIFGAGLLAFRRKKSAPSKRSSRKRLGSVRPFELALAAICVAICIILSSCSQSGGSIPIVNLGGLCPAGDPLAALPSSCCNAAGVQISKTGNCAGMKTPDLPGTADAIAQAANAVAAAKQATNIAESLLGSGGQMAKGGGVLAAATAGKNGTIGPQYSSNSGKASVVRANGLRSGSGASGAGGASGAPGGNLSGMKTGSDDSKGTESGEGSRGLASSDAVAVPAGGGGSGGSAGGNTLSWFNKLGDGSGGGLDGAAGAGGNTDAVAFAGANGGAGAYRALASEDPADYFTRTGIQESLFKTVERRYKKTAFGWANQDIKGLKSPAAKASSENYKAP